MIWDEQHVKALLRLPRFPESLLEEEPWASWLSQRGGPEPVRAELRQLDLPAVQQELLELILNGSHASALAYAHALHVSTSSYFRYLSTLVASLVEALNRGLDADG